MVGPSTVVEKDGYAFFQLVAEPQASRNLPEMAEVRFRGTATWGTDFVNLTTSANIPPFWQRPDAVGFQVLQDSAAEGPEELIIEFIPRPGDMSGYTWPAPFRVRILDDETIGMPAVELFGSFALPEGSESYNYEARLTRPAQEALSVQWRLSGQTAVVGADFVAAEGLLEFPAGATTASFRIALLNDSAFETAEDLHIELFNASPGLFAPNPTTEIVIQDDDLGYRFEDSSKYSDEKLPADTVRIHRVGSIPFRTTVQVRVEPITAVEGIDYPNEIYTVEFPPNELFANLTFRLLNDELEDGSKDLRLVLMNPSDGVRLMPGEETMIIRIFDNEFGYSLARQDGIPRNPVGSFYEESAAYFVLAREGDYESPSELTVTFHEAVDRSGFLNPPATPGVDFRAGPVTVRFAQGEKSVRVPLPLIDDALPERIELLGLSFPQWVRGGEAVVMLALQIFDNEFNPLPAYSMRPIGQAAWGFAPAGPDKALAMLLQRDQDYNYTSTIVRLKEDGEMDPAFAPVSYPGAQRFLHGLNGSTFLLDSPNHSSFTRFRRLNADGAVDPTFAPFEDRAQSGVSPGANGELFIGVEGDPSHFVRILKLGRDGASDPTFAAPQIQGTVRFLAAAPDGGVYVGSFVLFTVGGLQTYLAKFAADGSVDPSVHSDIYLNNLALIEGELFASRPEGFTRLLPTGQLDPTFAPVPGEATGWANWPPLRDSNGRFYSINGLGDYPTYYLTRFTQDGAPDPSYFPGTIIFRAEYGPGVWPDAALVVGDSLFVSGEFYHVNGTFVEWSGINSARIDLEPGYPYFQLDPEQPRALSESSPEPASFVVWRSGNNFDAPITMRYRVRSGSAIAGEDLPVQEGELVFAAGVSRMSVQLSAIDDSIAENSESFHIDFFLADGTPAGSNELTLESEEIGLKIFFDAASNQTWLVGVGLGRGSAMLFTSVDLVEWTYIGNPSQQSPFPVYPRPEEPVRFYKLVR